MKIYISGPITGVVGYMEVFNEAEEILTENGHTVVNPARVNAALPESTTHEEYMKMSFVMLEMCEMMLVLPGWKESKGCNMEIKYALENGIGIAFAGGKECQRSQSKQKRENLLQKLAKRFTGETKENVSFAQLDTRWTNRTGMVDRSSQSCITFLDPRMDVAFLRMEPSDANIITR